MSGGGEGRGGRPSMLHFPFLHFKIASVVVLFGAKERWLKKKIKKNLI
jgi:hypothetical protein